MRLMHRFSQLGSLVLVLNCLAVLSPLAFFAVVASVNPSAP